MKELYKLNDRLKLIKEFIQIVLNGKYISLEYCPCDGFIIDEEHYYYNDNEFDLYFIGIDENLNVFTHIEGEEKKEKFECMYKEIYDTLNKCDLVSFRKVLNTL